MVLLRNEIKIGQAYIYVSNSMYSGFIHALPVELLDFEIISKNEALAVVRDIKSGEKRKISTDCLKTIKEIKDICNYLKQTDNEDVFMINKSRINDNIYEIEKMIELIKNKQERGVL